MPEPIGLLPAAGRGLRFGASGYAKELFPLLLAGDPDAPLAPRPIAELALRGIAGAGARRCVVLISPDKTEVVRVLGDRLAGMSLAYVIQPEPLGLPDAIRVARPWLGDSDVLFALPDTVVLPIDAVARVHQRRLDAGADLALGVFPVDEPERLGPVELDGDGEVVRIYDKPAVAPARNSWGVAAWSAAFTELCCRWEADRVAAGSGGEAVIGHVFEAARRRLPTVALPFDDGTMLDIGTPRGLRASLDTLARHGVLDPVQAPKKKK